MWNHVPSVKLSVPRGCRRGRVPPACPPRAPHLVLLGTRASLLVLLTFLQEETSLHSSLTSVELISNENHLSLTKTVTLDCAGVRVGGVGGLSQALEQTCRLIMHLLPLPPGSTARRSPRPRCLRTGAPCSRRS